MRLEVTGLTQPVGESIEDSQPVAVLCVVGPNWLVTVHDAPVTFLEEFRERVEGGSDLGDLDAVAFLATLLHWQLTSYDEEIRRIIATLDELEDQALRDSASQQETLEQLVSLRRRISRLRALLAPHEPVFAELARPEFDRLSTSESAEAFRTLADRAAASVATVEGAREMLLGAFEILMTRTAQKTNDVVKLLTILTVMLLPSTLIAGILGMNFHPSFFDTPSLFWAALGLMILTMSITLFTIRRRGALVASAPPGHSVDEELISSVTRKATIASSRSTMTSLSGATRCCKRTSSRRRRLSTSSRRRPRTSRASRGRIGDDIAGSNLVGPARARAGTPGNGCPPQSHLDRTADYCSGCNLASPAPRDA